MEDIIKQKQLEYLDKSKPLSVRKKLYKDLVEKALNPFKDFNPDDFEPAGEEMKELSFRTRKKPPKELPTFGIKPKEILVGQMIGMYESKQDLYLIFAHRCNDLQKQIDNLVERIKNLEKGR